MASQKLICLLQKVLSVCGQDVIVKEEVPIELHPDYEYVETGQEMIFLTPSVSSADSGYQNLNIQEMSTVGLVCREGVEEQTQFTGDHRQLEHNVSEILNKDLGCSEEGLNQSVESNRNTKYMGTVVSNEDTAGEFVEQTGIETLKAQPWLSGKTYVMPRRPLFGTAKETSSIRLQPSSVEQVGSLKW
jgi:hypothetical protein